MGPNGTKMKYFLVFLALVGGVVSKHEMYDGFKVYNIKPLQHNQFAKLRALEAKIELDFWQLPIHNREGRVMVAPQDQAYFEIFLALNGIKYELTVDNVKSMLEDEDVMLEMAEARSVPNGRSLSYTTYHRYAAIDEYITSLGVNYPNLVTVVTGGQSTEGRNIKYAKISTTNFQDQSKPVIIIDAGIHAREWIAVPGATYALEKLVQSITEPDLIQNADWIILPLVNPDGYEYSHTNSRLWRKDRSSTTTIFCRGVDGNRNYDFFWNTVGVNSWPCSDVYPGSAAFSTPETRIVRDIILENLSRTELYITIHSFGSYILYPWGNDGSLPSNALEIHNVGVLMARAIDANTIAGVPNYIVGNAGLALNYFASGASEDWARLVGVPLSYTYELPGWFNSQFQLPTQHIEQVVKETWEGFVVGARYAIDKWRRRNMA